MDMTMRKTVLYITSAALGLVGLGACSNFEDMNIDPEHLSGGNLNYNQLFTGAQVQALGSDWDVWRNGVIYCSTMMQHITAVESWEDYVFYAYNEGYNAAFWEIYSSDNRGAIREIINVINQWKDAAGFENDYQMARILKAYMFHRMTDLYGDIPYSEVGRISEGIGYPKYDTQKDIYDNLLKELDEAQAAISGSNSQLGSADLYYGGDAGKWKKFANSLMLRVAMRLSKVDAGKAETWTKKALANGLFTSVDDNAMLLHTDGTPSDDSAEPYAKVFSELSPGEFFICKTFLDMLTNAGDPRTALIATICKDPTKGYLNSQYQKGDPTPTNQAGLPAGYKKSGSSNRWDFSQYPGYHDDDYQSHYSVPSRYTYSDPKTAPTMIVTHAENQLLLAEAAVRGWITDPAEDYFKKGVKAAMEQFKFYSGAADLYAQYLTPAAIDKYVGALSLIG